MEKKTQQHEGHALTESLPYHHVLPKDDMFPGKKQSFEQGITQTLQVFDQLKPHILWLVLVVIAIYDYIHLSDIVGFLVLITAAAGAISLRQAIELLQGRAVSPFPPSEADDQSEKQIVERQDRSV